MKRSDKPASVGARRWAIAEGYIPAWSRGPKPELESHETLCVLNTGARSARLTLTVYFSDRGPAGPYRASVSARRTLHLRLNDLRKPERLPAGKDFAVLLESDRPVVVQHTRLDSRQAANALMTTLAFPAGRAH